jgi:hypothetical protein
VPVAVLPPLLELLLLLVLPPLLELLLVLLPLLVLPPLLELLLVLLPLLLLMGAVGRGMVPQYGVCWRERCRILRQAL